jgi:carboxyl-terminal processing protease
MRRRRSPVPVLVVLLPVLLVAGIWLGGHPSTLPGFARDALVDDGDAQVYQEALDLIQRDYYRKVDRDRLLNESLGAAVKSLDDQFSGYFSPEDYADFQEATQGQFEGVGMTVEEAPRGLTVLTVYDGSPADAGGLKPGDVVTEVNDKRVTSANGLIALIRSYRPGDEVTVTYVRDGDEHETDVTLDSDEGDLTS